VTPRSISAGLQFIKEFGMKILSIVLTAMLLTLTSQVFAGEQDSMGKIKLTFVIVAPGNLSDEGKQLFLSHAA
jgi:hypothetical protein